MPQSIRRNHLRRRQQSLHRKRVPRARQSHRTILVRLRPIPKSRKNATCRHWTRKPAHRNQRGLPLRLRNLPRTQIPHRTRNSRHNQQMQPDLPSLLRQRSTGRIRLRTHKRTNLRDTRKPQKQQASSATSNTVFGRRTNNTKRPL
jgi:hypothetical protein